VTGLATAPRSWVRIRDAAGRVGPRVKRWEDLPSLSSGERDPLNRSVWVGTRIPCIRRETVPSQSNAVA
jgi:hypothetical protein